MYMMNTCYCTDALQPDLKRDWKNFCDYIKDKCSQMDMDKTKVNHIILLISNCQLLSLLGKSFL